MASRAMRYEFVKKHQSVRIIDSRSDNNSKNANTQQKLVTPGTIAPNCGVPIGSGGYSVNNHERKYISLKMRNTLQNLVTLDTAPSYQPSKHPSGRPASAYRYRAWFERTIQNLKSKIDKYPTKARHPRHKSHLPLAQHATRWVLRLGEGVRAVGQEDEATTMNQRAEVLS